MRRPGKMASLPGLVRGSFILPWFFVSFWSKQKENKKTNQNQPIARRPLTSIKQNPDNDFPPVMEITYIFWKKYLFPNGKKLSIQILFLLILISYGEFQRCRIEKLIINEITTKTRIPLGHSSAKKDQVLKKKIKNKTYLTCLIHILFNFGLKPCNKGYFNSPDLKVGATQTRYT